MADSPDEQIVEWSATERYARYGTQLGRGAFKTVYKGFDADRGCEIAWNQASEGFIRGAGLSHSGHTGAAWGGAMRGRAPCGERESSLACAWLSTGGRSVATLKVVLLSLSFFFFSFFFFV